MSLRGKLILGFLVASLSTVLLFTAIAYTSAVNFSRHQETALLHSYNRHLVEMLRQGESTLDRLRELLQHHESDHNSVFIIDTQGRQLSGNPGISRLRRLLSKHVAARLASTDSAQGMYEFNNSEHVWAADRVPDTPYLIVNAYHKDGNFSAFVQQIGVPLAVASLIAAWLSLWGGMIMAALLKKLSYQNRTLQDSIKQDPLTKLPNRTALVTAIAQAIDEGHSPDSQMTLCIISLHRFKDINDSLGHEGGDDLLHQVSTRLQHVSRNTDMVARFGGNKFAIFLNNSNGTAADIVSKKLLSALEPAFEVAGHYLYMRGTLGLALYPQHARDAQTLVQKAEIAMYQAKEGVRDYAVYRAEADTGSIEHLDLANDLRHAIADDQLELYYQPQLDLRTGIITGVEALARWTHPKYGFVPPDKFVDIAERTGLIKQLTEWVLKTAIKHCAHWHRTGRKLHVSVNLSARNLHDEHLTHQVATLLDHWNVPAEHLALEITETAMMADPNHARKLLLRLDALGVRISIDDFGTGYSSLGYLKQLPVDEIKIDKSFVLNMGNDENDASIVRATIGLAHDLGLEVVAEGIEDAASQDKLLQLGCDMAQGYHIGRPMPQTDLMQMLRAQPVNLSPVVNSSSTGTP